MRSSNRKHTPAPWPFWLLLAAWLCANSPPSATYTALTWLGEARSFSHQQRLTVDVAFLLVGEKAPGLLAGLKRIPPAPARPVLPVNTALKKIELALAETIEVLPALSAVVHGAFAPPADGTLRARPPHGPPRAMVLT